MLTDFCDGIIFSLNRSIIFYILCIFLKTLNGYFQLLDSVYKYCYKFVNVECLNFDLKKKNIVSIPFCIDL
jgi:hypothetical protein